MHIISHYLEDTTKTSQGSQVEQILLSIEGLKGVL